MKTSITRNSNIVAAAWNSKAGHKVLVVAFWLAIWQAASIAIGHELLMVSPLSVVTTLAAMVADAGFWSAIGYSFVRIISGFFLGIAVATVLAVASAANGVVKSLLSPFFGVIKSIPVASFIILVLIWSGSGSLSVVISFLIVLPIIYTNVLEGILRTDGKLLEMADVFNVSVARKIKAIYIPAILPYFTSACKVALGLCWKSGIAAEVIGLPGNSIGEQLYNAKIFLSTGELFGWTLVIVAVSFLFEKFFLTMLRRFERRLIGSALA